MTKEEVTKKLLKGLYYGEIDICEEGLHHKDEYRERLHELNVKMGELVKKLTPEQKEMFIEYNEMYGKTLGTEGFYYFCRGWEMALNFVAATDIEQKNE